MRSIDWDTSIDGKASHSHFEYQKVKLAMSKKMSSPLFTHVLIPTDGSELSDKAIERGIHFAKQIGAKVTGFHAIPVFRTFTGLAGMLELTPDAYLESAKAHARRILDKIQRAADEAGVECDVELALSDHPHEVIMAIAHQKKCDLIIMASHGRRGLKGVLLGSETQKVLTHGKLPVLVLR